MKNKQAVRGLSDWRSSLPEGEGMAGEEVEAGSRAGNREMADPKCPYCRGCPLPRSALL